jgi:agmatinase
MYKGNEMHTVFEKDNCMLFGNAMTFMRRPLVLNPLTVEADVVVLGLPYDMATSGRSGARMGPDAMRKASTNLAWEDTRYPWQFALNEHCNVVDAGDLTYMSGDSAEFTEKVEAAATSILEQGKSMLSFGGDHFVTLLLLRAHAKKFGKMALVHFDAHTDTYSNGSAYDHGTMFFHAPNEGLIDKHRSVQVGIRTNYTEADHGFTVIDGQQGNELSADAIAEIITNTVGDLPVYLTFDIDALDPAFAPGTGTPVCGGLTTNKVLNILRALKGLNLVGMDVVEVAPAYDNSDVTALAGASIALELLHLWTHKHKL